MKKIIIISLAIVTAIVSSCRIDRAQPASDITLRGQHIFEIASKQGITPYLIGLDNVLKAEEIVYAPIEKSDSLEDLYFPQYKIRSDKDSIYLIGNYASIFDNKNEIISVCKKNDIPITEVGAVRIYSSHSFLMRITCISNDLYELASEAFFPNEPSTVMQARISRFFSKDWKYPSSIYCYQLSGYGLYSEIFDSSYVGYYDGYIEKLNDSHYDLNYSFDTEKPLTSIRLGYLDSFWFYAGYLHMEVTGTALGNETDEVDASLSCRKSDLNVNFVVNTIHYKGETRDWNISN